LTTVTEGAVCNDTNLNNNTPQGPCTVSGVSMPGGLPNPEKSQDNVNRPETGLIVKFNPSNNEWEDERPSSNWNAQSANWHQIKPQAQMKLQIEY
jgi:hypothetical protein